MKRIIFSITENFLKDIDNICSLNSYDRSEFIRMCIRNQVYNGIVNGFERDKYPKLISMEITEDGPIPFDKEERGISLSKIVADKKIKTCKHGYAIGNCKYGCKK